MKILNTTDKNRCNCVLWLREHLPELPTGLWTLDDKEAIINSQTPVIGSGAMSADGIWFIHEGKKVFSGHVALVTKVKDDLLTIQEANYKSCTVTEREGTKDKLKIVGFFVPDRLKKNEEPMEKYHCTSDLEKELKKIYPKFDGDTKEGQKKMAKKLDEYIELNAESLLHFQLETNKIPKLQNSLDTLRLTSAEDTRNYKDEIRILQEELGKKELALKTAGDVIRTSITVDSDWSKIWELIINKVKNEPTKV